MIKTQTIALHHDGADLEGFLAIPAGPGPLHRGAGDACSALGLCELVRRRASELAERGYVAIATDMYGGGVYFNVPEDAGAAMIALHNAPQRLRSRAVAWCDAAKALPQVDALNVWRLSVIASAVNACWNSPAVGADVRVAVSYHGLLSTAMPATAGAIKARVAIYTGALDPYAPDADVEHVRRELADAGADWQITTFGDAAHGFTDPDAATQGRPGIAYHPVADRVSWAGTLALLEAAC